MINLKENQHIYIRIVFFVLYVVYLASASEKIFENALVDNIVSISYPECINECDSNSLCTHAKYTSRLQLCEHFKKYVGNSNFEREPGIMFYERKDFHQACDNNSDFKSCKIKTCPPPLPMPDTKLLGNMLKIGSKLKYQCIDSDRSLIITCQENGTWTGGDLFCYCKPPDHIDHGRLTSRNRLNETHFIANVTCDEGYILRQNGDISCDVTKETWTVENACCDKMVDGEWQKIYSYPKETDLDLISNLDDLHGKMDREIGPYCFFRNTTVFESWLSLNISRVKLVVKHDKEVAAFLLFNGTGSKHLEWFTQSRLLNSSWYDLNASAPFNQFSFYGFSSTTTSNLRFFISQHFSWPENCYKDLGWFVVSWSYYPCDSTITGKRILYAKNHNVSRFVTEEEEVGFADRYEFWIKREP